MASGGNILQRIIRLVFDRAAAQRAQQQAEGSVGTIDRAFGKLKTAALGVGAAIGAAFALRRLVDFGRASVREAAEAEKSWTRLSQSLGNVGVSFDAMERRLRLAAAAMQDTTRFSDEEFAESLSEIVQISGDYEQSFRNVALAMDIAAAKRIDLRTASLLVGRAMIGETALLKRYGIVVKEGSDAVEVMRQQFAGFAEREGKTFAGRLAQYTNALSDFREEVGNVIVGFLEKTGVIEALTAAIKRATAALAEFNKTAADRAQDEVAALSGENLQRTHDQLIAAQVRIQDRIRELEESRAKQTTAHGIKLYEDALRTNRSELTRHFAAIGRIEAEMRNRQMLSGVAGIFDPEEAAKAAAEAERRRVAEIRALHEAINLRTLTADGIARAGELEADITAELGRGNIALERRNQLVKEQAQLLTVMKQGVQLPEAPPPGLAGVGAGVIRGQIRAGTLPGVGVGLPTFDETQTARFQREVQDRLEGLRQIESAAMAASSAMQAGFQDAFSQLFDDFGNFEAFATGIFQAIGAGVIAGVAQLARSKVAENLAFAIEELARGLSAATWNPPAAAAHFASAKQHGLAAIAWSAIGGAAGAAGSAIAGGRNTANTFTTPLGGRAGDTSRFNGDRMGPDVTIILEGDFDALDPRVQRVIYSAHRHALEQYGTRGRVVKPTRRS